MKVVVTGASGWLGRAVARHLRTRGVDVVGVSRRAGATDLQVADYACAPAGDVLVHLAQTANRAEANADGDTLAAAARATLAALLANGYARTVFASSGVLYGDRDAAPRRVDDEVHVVDTYTRMKRDSELAVLDRQGGCVARLTNLYGPGGSRATVTGTVLAQIPGSGALRVHDDTPVRDFLWLDDAAAALAAMALGDARGVFNVGTGIGTSIGELARLALDIAGEAQRPVVAAVHGTASRLVLDAADTCRAFDWQPLTPLGTGLHRLLAHEQRENA